MMERTRAPYSVLSGLFALWIGVASDRALAASWVALGPEGADVTTLAVAASSPEVVYLGTFGGGVFKSTNGAASWLPASAGLPDLHIQQIVVDPKNPDNVYALAAPQGSGFFFRSTDGGASWSAAGNGLGDEEDASALAIDPVNPSTLYLGSFTRIYKSTTSGTSWVPADTEFPELLGVEGLAVDPANPAIVYAASAYEGVFKSTDGGTHWENVSTELIRLYGAHAVALDPMSPGTMYVGTRIGVFRSFTGGADWEPTPGGLPGTAEVLVVDAEGSVYAGLFGADRPGIFKTTNGGDTWEPADTGFPSGYVYALTVHPTDTSIAYAGTSSHGVFKTTTGGALWTASNAGLINTSFRSLAVDPTNPGTLYAGDVTVSKSTTRGETWTDASQGLPDDSLVTLVVDPADGDVVYAGTAQTGLYKSLDGGASWGPINDGLVPAAVQAFAIDPENTRVLYLSMGWRFLDGGTFRSDDGGASWSPVNPDDLEADIFALAIDPSRPATLYGGTSNGVMKTISSGASWERAGLPSARIVALVVDPADGDTVYAAAAGGVFKSTTAAASWTRAGLEGLEITALAIDPRDPRLLYAATDHDGIFVTTDGGATWQAINTGLTSLFVRALGVEASPHAIYASTFFRGVFRLEPRCGDGVVDPGERCDEGANGGGCCTAACQLAAAGTTCRVAAAACDVAETCSGESSRCPDDAFAASTEPCRSVADGCDVAERCPGGSAECPPDRRKPDADGDGACDDQDACPTDATNVCDPNLASAVIGGAGGRVAIPDRVALEVPVNSLSAPTTITVQNASGASAFGAGHTAKNLVALVRLTPDGLAVSPPVTVTLRWSDSDDDGIVDGTRIREKNLRVFRNGTEIAGTDACEHQGCSAAACCDAVANSWSVQLSQLGELAVGLAPCVEVNESTLALRRLRPPAGDERLHFGGVLTLGGADPIASQLDVVRDGLVVRLVDGDAVALETEIPGGSYDSQARSGWKMRAGRRGTPTWTYVGPRGGDVAEFVLRDLSAHSPGRVGFSVKGRGSVVAGTDLAPALVLPDSGQCFEAAAADCTARKKGATIVCK